MNDKFFRLLSVMMLLGVVTGLLDSGILPNVGAVVLSYFVGAIHVRAKMREGV